LRESFKLKAVIDVLPLIIGDFAQIFTNNQVQQVWA